MKFRNILVLLLLFCFSTALTAQKYMDTEASEVKRTYNGAEFSSKKSLLENLSEVPGFTVYRGFLENHSDALMPEGFMGTVFVLPDSAFSTDPEDTDAPDISDLSLQKKIMQSLIIPGRVDAHAMKKAATKGGGSARFSTLSGQTLTVKIQGDDLLLLDAEGNASRLIATDMYHKEGFFHIAEKLLLPE